MPTPNVLFTRLGFWHVSDLPNDAQVRVLHHLTLCDGEPRLYLKIKGTLHSAALSNCDDAPGFVTRVQVENHLLFHKWVTEDQTETAKCREPVVAVYKITNKGREALVQVYARKEYEKLVEEEMPKRFESLRQSLGLQK